jgi:hypothetical protein
VHLDGWQRSIAKAIQDVAPEVAAPRHERPSVPITAEQLAEHRTSFKARWPELARIEILRIRDILPHLVFDADRAIANATSALTVYNAAFGEILLDRFDGPHNRDLPKLRLDGNDWNDLAQLRYLQRDRRWVTRDVRWRRVVASAGHSNRVIGPEDL